MFAVMNFSIAVLSIFDVAFEHEEDETSELVSDPVSLSDPLASSSWSKCHVFRLNMVSE
eukprot:jgi/Pico_ML_1/53231/g3809.t1